ncbi:MAG: hypothetical protein U0271_37155 [Polyangiaceae bacterium]
MMARPWMSALALAAIALSSSARADDAEVCATQAESALDAKDTRPADALPLFEACAKDSCPRVVREDCRAALAELRETAPRLTVVVRDKAGSDVAQAVVTLDGAPLSLEERTRGVVVNPGTHVLVASQGAASVTRELVVAAGEGRRAVELELVAEKGDTTDPHERGLLEVVKGPDRVPPIVVGSIGIASLVAFTVLASWTYADFKHLEDTCGPSCLDADVDPVRTRALAADVTLAVGATSLVVATILWFAMPERRPRAQALVTW